MFGRYITWVMILHGIEYQRPTSLNMRILADHVTYSFLAFMKSIFHFCLGCYCGGYSQNGRSNLSSFDLLSSLPLSRVWFFCDCRPTWQGYTLGQDLDWVSSGEISLVKWEHNELINDLTNWARYRFPMCYSSPIAVKLGRDVPLDRISVKFVHGRWSPCA